MLDIIFCEECSERSKLLLYGMSDVCENLWDLDFFFFF